MFFKRIEQLLRLAEILAGCYIKEFAVFYFADDLVSIL
jgi:hypothetical protein